MSYFTAIVIHNPFDKNWIEGVKKAAYEMDISDYSKDRVLVDSNLDFVLIEGHHTAGSFASMCRTIISLKSGNLLEVKTTIRTSTFLLHLFFPMLIIVWALSSLTPLAAFIITGCFSLIPLSVYFEFKAQHSFSRALSEHIVNTD